MKRENTTIDIHEGMVKKQKSTTTKTFDWFSKVVIEEDRCQSCNARIPRFGEEVTEDDDEGCDEDDYSSVGGCDGCGFKACRNEDEKRAFIVSEEWGKVKFDHNESFDDEFDDNQASELAKAIVMPGSSIWSVEINSDYISRVGVQRIVDAFKVSKRDKTFIKINGVIEK